MVTAYEQIDAVNWSSLKYMATSARLLQWRTTHPRPDSPALRLGRAIHCALLEPERWPSAYVVAPDVDRRTKIGKADWAAFQEALDPAAELLSADEHALAERCADAIREHPRAVELLTGVRTEETLTWTDDATGLPCKARLDTITPRYVLDLKSTRRESIAQIKRDFASFLYHGQLAWYHDGAIASRLIPPDARTPYVIVVQTVEPYDVVPGRIMAEDLERGRALYRSLLDRYAQCKAADWWPGLAPDLVDLDLPAWAPAGDENKEESW